MADFNTAQVHVDRPLTNYAIGYSNKDFIGRKILGRVLVGQQSDQFYVRSKREMLQYADNELPMDGPAIRITDASVTTSSFLCKAYGNEEKVVNSTQIGADVALNPRMDATDRVMARVGLADEVRIASLLTTSGNFASTNRVTLSGTDQWSDSSGGDPVGVVAQYMSTIFNSPGAKKIGYMGIDVWNKLKTNAKLLDRTKYTGLSSAPANVQKRALAELFELDELFVGEAWKEASNPGQTASYARVWGKFFGVVAVDPRPSVKSLQFATLFDWAFAPGLVGPGANMAAQIQTRPDPDSPGLAGAEIIKAVHATDYKLTANDAGFLISAAVA